MGRVKAKDIADCLIFWRERERINHIIIFSDSIRNDEHFNALSDQRVQNINFLITPLLEEKTEIKYCRAFHDQCEAATGAMNEVQISIQPQCKRSGNCCGGNST